jgi:vanillate O-demethylase monooxygenase subunit
MTEAGVHLSGSARSTASVSRVMHLLTPETNATTHYFWSVVRNYHIEDDAMTEAVRKSVGATFDEDKAILELQQKAVDEAQESTLPRFALKLDEAPLRARRMLGKLIRLQAADPQFKIPVRPLVPDEASTPAMQSNEG